MRRIETFKFRIEPKSAALEKIRRFAGCRRYVWNRLLAEREAAWKALGESPDAETKKAFNREWSYNGMAGKITIWRHETDWLAECPVHALQNAAKDLQGAYERWWKGISGKPRFKKKSMGRDSWRESDPALVEVNGQAIRLPKIGWVRARISKKIVGSVRFVTVRREGEQWFASVTTEREVEDPKQNGESAIGLDRGVVHAVVGSDGRKHSLAPMTEREERHLARLARAMSRKKKGSKNREKAKIKLNRAKSRIDRRVRHEMHVFTFRTAKHHGLVGIEDLHIQAMTRSAAGTQEDPGTNVAAKRGLNREILRRRWGEMGRQFGYKCVWYGSNLVGVEAAYSSLECSECGHIDKANRPTRDLFRCVQCGHEEDADVNAAKVVLKRALKKAAGHAASACGEDVRPGLSGRTSKKQEPARREAS